MFGAGEFFLLGLLTHDRRNGQILAAQIRIDLQHQLRALFRFFGCGVDRVAFLPQEFTGTEERSRFLFPAHDRAPLIVQARQIAVGMYVVFIKVAEQRLGRWPHTETLLQRFLSAVCDPGHLRRKAFHMILFFLQQGLRDQHRHIHIFHSRRLEARIQMFLDRLPQRIAGRLDHHKSLDVGIGDEPRLDHNIRIPLRKIILHRGDRFYQFFLFCHVLLLRSVDTFLILCYRISFCQERPRILCIYFRSEGPPGAVLPAGSGGSGFRSVHACRSPENRV